MCGYCTEEIALDVLRRDVQGNLQMKELGGNLHRYFYLRETPGFLPRLDRLKRSLIRKKLPLFSEIPQSILLYRGLEILWEKGYTSPEYQQLLKMPLYREAIPAVCSAEQRQAFHVATEGLDVDFLGLLYDPETYFREERSKQLRTLAMVLPSCRNILKHYISWWLDGKGLQKDEDIQTDTEDTRFSMLFRAIYFSILVVGNCQAGKKMMTAIAERNPAGTPLIDANDLWLQRIAALKLYDREGFEAFAKRLKSIRYGQCFYIDQIRGFSLEQKQVLLDEVKNSQNMAESEDLFFMAHWLSEDLGLHL